MVSKAEILLYCLHLPVALFFVVKLGLRFGSSLDTSATLPEQENDLFARLALEAEMGSFYLSLILLLIYLATLKSYYLESKVESSVKSDLSEVGEDASPKRNNRIRYFHVVTAQIEGFVLATFLGSRFIMMDSNLDAVFITTVFGIVYYIIVVLRGFLRLRSFAKSETFSIDGFLLLEDWWPLNLIPNAVVVNTSHCRYC